MARRFQFGGPATNSALLRGQRGRVARRWYFGSARRRIEFSQRVFGELQYQGSLDRGVNAETRVLTGLEVTNNGTVAVCVEVEEEATHTAFSATIQPGETKSIPVEPLTQYWNGVRPIVPGWDGLNIRWKEPA